MNKDIEQYLNWMDISNRVNYLIMNRAILKDSIWKSLNKHHLTESPNEKIANDITDICIKAQTDLLKEIKYHWIGENFTPSENDIQNKISELESLLTD